MPYLPSGLGLALGYQAIPESMPNWFAAARWHFWHFRPDEQICPPPYEPGANYLQDCVKAPVPETIEEVKHYIQVLYRQDDGSFCWKGEWLDEFPRFCTLDADDQAAWQTWLSGDGNIRFMEQVIEHCRRQAAINSVLNGVLEDDR